ncbi:MAG: glycoside hydrolase family 3 C-terminal domain-containing protein [Rikenellaceae bacterium]
MNYFRIPAVIVCSLTLFTTNSTAGEPQLPIYQDPSYTPHQRAIDLVSQLTIDEKASQMVNDAEAIPRLGIDAYSWWNEALHGLARSGRSTIFPQSIGLAATFDPQLLEQMASAIGDEARAAYLNAIDKGNFGRFTGLTFYSPNVNLYRDPRWGRGQETYGEDPYLISQLGVAFVKGLQGDDPQYMKSVACAKHYAVHSGPEGVRLGFNAIATQKDMYETYLPAFKALVQDAKVGSVMSAYNALNGEPCAVNDILLNDILRDDWGFEGYVTSDCGALWQLINGHKMCKTATEAAALAINRGLNLECGELYRNAIPQAIDQELITEEQVDSLLVTLMEYRFRLGLFDKAEDVEYMQIDRNIVDSPAHRNIAYRAALESIVLLENKDNLLPLDSSINYIYVTGPNANNPDALIGNYFGASNRLTTFYEGLAEKMPQGTAIQYRQGAMLTAEATNNWTVKEAPDADVVIACIGLTNMLEGESMDAIASEDEGDIPNLSLPASQINFLKSLKENVDERGKRLIVIVTGGSPILLTEVRQYADALLYAWYPGEAGGSAMADIIFGNASPSARTPMTFVKSVDQLPPFEDYSMVGRTYRYMETEPLYPFGYGLSYTNFEYSYIEAKSKITAGEALDVKVTITNRSNFTGEEVVQLYITDLEASTSIPIRQLAAFTRVEIQAGDTKEVTLTISPEKMSVVTDDLKRKIESGRFYISVGAGQPLPITSSYVDTTFEVKKSIELPL